MRNCGPHALVVTTVVDVAHGVIVGGILSLAN
jgi:hypothetical protein